MAKSAKKQAVLLQKKAKEALAESVAALKQLENAKDETIALELAMRAEVEAGKAKAFSEAARTII